MIVLPQIFLRIKSDSAKSSKIGPHLMRL